jgi:hypothetical protein
MAHYPAPGVYTSPIPAIRTHLGHALASEWTKIRTVRSTIWSLGVMLCLVVGVGLLMTATVGRNDYGTTPMLSYGLAGSMLGQLCVVTLGVLVITSEYGTGMIRTTFTACPQRGRVLTAKAIVFSSLTLVLSLASCTAVALFSWALLGGRRTRDFQYDHVGSGFASDVPEVPEVVVGATGSEWFRATVGVAVFMALIGLMSLAVGTLLRHTAGAITTMLGLLLLPLLVAVFMPFGGFQEGLIEYSAPNVLATLYGIPMEGEGSGWGLLAAFAALTATVLCAAYAVLERRDV